MQRIDFKFLRQLYYFSVVAEYKNISRAAEKLHISQPPLSAAISDLEERIGFNLFERHPGGVGLTEAGKRILPIVKSFNSHAELLEYSLNNLRASDLHLVKIAAVHDGMLQVISPLTSRLERANSNIRIFAKEEDSPLLPIAVIQNEVLAGIGYLWALKDPRLKEKRIAKVPLKLVVPSYHRLANKKSVSLTELDDENLVVVGRESSPWIYDKLISLFDLYGIKPRIQHEVISLNRLLGFAACGQGLALVPTYESTVLPKELREIAICEENAYVELSVIWKASVKSDPLLQLIEAMDQLSIVSSD